MQRSKSGLSITPTWVKVLWVCSAVFTLVCYASVARESMGNTPYMFLYKDHHGDQFGTFSMKEQNECRAYCYKRGDCQCQQMVETTRHAPVTQAK